MISTFIIRNKEIQVLTNDNFYFLPILYKENKNKSENYWSVEMYSDKYIVRTGKVDGKERVFEKPVKEGKGKLTVQEQVISNAVSEWNKKKDKGYFTKDNVNVETELKDTSFKLLRPMSAQSYEKHSGKIKEPFAISPKLDGIRALCYIENDDVYIMSKLGKYYNFMDNLRKDIKKCLKRINRKLVKKYNQEYQIALDGELFSEELKFDQIQSIVTSKKTRDENEDKIQLWLFDLYVQGNDLNYKDRMKLLRKASKDLPFIRLVDYEIMSDKKEIENKLEEYSKKFEGIMIRNLDSLYLKGFRSFDLQKLKKFYDKEFEIIDTTIGKGTHEGCIIYVCKTENGETFSVSPKLDLEMRKKLAEDEDHKKNVIGKMYTVRYQELTKTGKPRFPVGISVRDYE